MLAELLDRLGALVMDVNTIEDLLTLQTGVPGSPEVLDAVERLLDAGEDQRVDLLLGIGGNGARIKLARGAPRRGWEGAWQTDGRRRRGTGPEKHENGSHI